MPEMREGFRQEFCPRCGSPCLRQEETTPEGVFALYRCTKSHGSINSPSSNLMKKVRIGDPPAQGAAAEPAKPAIPKSGRARIAAARAKQLEAAKDKAKAGGKNVSDSQRQGARGSRQQ
jgi:hypothetical protein